jgi:pimeloyl-ACP methyl ester carboxylesterase
VGGITQQLCRADWVIPSIRPRRSARSVWILGRHDTCEEHAMAEIRTIDHQPATTRRREPGGDAARRELLAPIPVAERRLHLAGIPTAVLEGGSGPPLVLLHGPAGYAAHWMHVIPGLVATHCVVAPDLPGHGASNVGVDPLDAGRVLAWLGDLIDQTCPSPPALVGQLLGGAIAARFALDRPGRASRLVLIDTFGLCAFEPEPAFGQALNAFLAQPTEQTHEHLWRQCAFDLDGLRQRMGQRWQPFMAYNIDRIRTPAVQAALHTLMQQFGTALAPAELERIDVPTALIWGRHDRATPLSVAEAASSCYHWPLHVIDDANDDPPVERPDALLRVLRAVLDGATP